MTLEEYKAKLDKLEDEFRQTKMQLAKEFALSNNPYKKGDKITDNIGSIIIEKIMFSLYPSPMCVYEGIIINKNGSPSINGKRRCVYQSHIK